ncbi:MAG TPA: hypothetical protein P5081_23360, partial [Phycisphaerae bacterium]|nr:hypothetical protein [Phycisphaerae bacterium]
SQEIHVSGFRGLNTRKAQAKIGEIVGDTELPKNFENGFSPMWETSKIGNMSADKLRDFVVHIIGAARGGDEIDTEAALRRIYIAVLKSQAVVGEGTVDEFLYSRCGVRNERDATWDHIKSLIAEKVAPSNADALREILNEVGEDLCGETPEAIKAVLEHAKDIVNGSKREAEAAYRSAEDQTDTIAAKRNEVPAGDIDTLTEQVSDLNSRRDGIIDRKAAQEQRDERIADANKRNGEIVSRLMTLAEEIETLEANPVSTDSAKALLDEASKLDAQADADKSVAEAREALEAEQLRIAGATKVRADERRKITNELSAARNEFEKANAAKREAMDRIDQYERDLKASNENKAELEALQARHAADPLTAIRKSVIVLIGQIPEDGGEEAIQTGNEIVDFIDANQKPDVRLATAEQDIEDLDEKIAAATDQIASGSTARTNAETLAAAIAERVFEIEARLLKFDDTPIADDNRTTLQANLHTAENTVAAIRREAHDKRIAANRVRDAAASYAERLRTRQAERDRLGAEREELVDAIDKLKTESEFTVAALEEQLADVDSQIVAANAKIKAKQEFEAIERTLLDTRERAERQMARHEMGKVVVGAVKQLREELTREMVEPIIGLMNRVLCPIFDGRSEARIRLDNPTGKKDVFVFEWFMPTDDDETFAWRTLTSLSGGERAMYLAAMGWAVLQLANPPLKVLPIEAAEIDAENLRSLMAALDAVSDDVGNIIIATHAGITDEVLGDHEWTVIDMDAGTQRVTETAAA